MSRRAAALVVGLGCSTERDAMTLVRMQADMQNQGYAAGYAAARKGTTNPITATQAKRLHWKSVCQMGSGTNSSMTPCIAEPITWP